MDLYVHPASPNCVAVLAAAACLRQPLRVHHVDLFKGEHATREFLARNPNGLVPVLRDGDFVLWETAAILQFLAEHDPEAALTGRDAHQRADVARWLSWGLAHWNPALRPFIFERVFKPLKGLGQPDEAQLELHVPELRRRARILDDRLRESGFVCGDRLSIADLFLAAYPIYAHEARIDLDDYGHVRDWLALVHGSPGWRQALATPPQ